MSERRSELPTASLAAYLEGELPASEVRELEARLSESSEARRRLDELRAIRDELASLPEELAQVDLREAVRRDMQHGRAAPAPPTAPFSLAWLGAAACVLLAVAAGEFLPHPYSWREPEYRSKGASASRLEPVSVQAYVVAAEGAPLVPLLAPLAPGAGVVFSYINTGPSPYSHLMVFGVDRGRAVRWYYPAHTERARDPSSIAIRESGERIMLPDVVEHDLSAGPIALHALFTREPLHVSEVERWLSQEPAPRAPPWPRAALLQVGTLVGR